VNKILCFVYQEMADFEVTLALQILRNHGGYEVITAGCTPGAVTGQTGMRHQPLITLTQALEVHDAAGLLIPGGPIRAQGEDVTRLIQQRDGQGRLLAAICFGPQYLGRAGILDRHRFTTSCSAAHIQELGVPDPYPRQNYVEARAVQDGHVITAKGSAFVDFAFAVADYLGVYAGKTAERQRFFNDITGRAA